MIKQFTRKGIVADLKAKVKRKEPIIIGGAGIGLVAKIADRAGIDLITNVPTAGAYDGRFDTAGVGYPVPYRQRSTIF